MKNIKIVCIESDFGAGIKGAKLGPQALLNELPNHFIEGKEIFKISDDFLVDSEEDDHAKQIDSILEVQKISIEKLKEIIANNHFPWIISGDHSNGLAAISAYKDLYPNNRLGVIWIDAHADIHTPFTSPSGNMHGMPLAAALNIENHEKTNHKVPKPVIEKWEDFKKLGSNQVCPKLLPTDLVFIDIRDLEEEEKTCINNLNIKHFTPEDRRKIGIEKIIEETIRHLAFCNHILVSFDVDSLDPENSYGTGTPVPDGLSLNEAIDLLGAFLCIPNLLAFEITEINPLLDRKSPMEKVAAKVLEKAFEKAKFIS